VNPFNNLPVKFPMRVNRLIQIKKSDSELPIFNEAVQAGFPSPADDYIEKKLSLDELLIQHPVSTFFVRATGDSMTDVGIYPDDMLVVDKSISPKSGDIVIAEVNNEFFVKIFSTINGKPTLSAANKKKGYSMEKFDEFEIWGVVTSVIHRFRS
jgi:DNA polymerase V